jgi:ATPase subunit of ABC transporter with duplicated ATPase domains
MENVSFRIGKGDKVGLVGRNGAGKTTMTRALAGEGQPTGGVITRTGEIGYLPQDPRAGDPEQLARTRILDARGLGQIVIDMERSAIEMGSTDPVVAQKAMDRYGRLTDDFQSHLESTAQHPLRWAAPPY